ncbi:histidine phosphatase family protein [Enterococcus timonensis]|uniref:histidine phosphatase family protein n=1 Tax=Enterococcus timonensis TaxID=1852364 RepID=UPI000D093EF8|nr:histidine phosphatase family protein [Enterococcus timonensis]
MSEKTILYLVRHGKTMFNAIGRTQGWSDTPLTKLGEQTIHYLGLGLKDTPFKLAYSSDSGRAIQTMRLILGENPQGRNIDYFVDQRIREWCFGSLEGGYNGELWGVVPRILMYPSYDEMITKISYEDLANAILEADTAGWAQPYADIKKRISTGFEDIAQKVEKQGGGNALVVSHGMTISNFLHIIDPKQPLQHKLANGSICKVSYDHGKFEILSINDISYIEEGQKESNDLLK